MSYSIHLSEECLFSFLTLTAIGRSRTGIKTRFFSFSGAHWDHWTKAIWWVNFRWHRVSYVIIISLQMEISNTESNFILHHWINNIPKNSSAYYFYVITYCRFGHGFPLLFIQTAGLMGDLELFYSFNLQDINLLKTQCLRYGSSSRQKIQLHYCN